MQWARSVRVSLSEPTDLAGLMRCSAYSAVVNRPLVDRSRGDDAVAHFHEKLLKLSALMRTERGRDLARSRHRFMLDFLAQLDVEQASV